MCFFSMVNGDKIWINDNNERLFDKMFFKFKKCRWLNLNLIGRLCILVSMVIQKTICPKAVVEDWITRSVCKSLLNSESK